MWCRISRLDAFLKVVTIRRKIGKLLHTNSFPHSLEVLGTGPRKLDEKQIRRDQQKRI